MRGVAYGRPRAREYMITRCLFFGHGGGGNPIWALATCQPVEVGSIEVRRGAKDLGEANEAVEAPKRE